jgi:hypothetical protein
MKWFSFLILPAILIGCQQSGFDKQEAETEVNAMLDLWHLAAANAKYDAYFDCFGDSAVFIGTDAREIWSKAEFAAYAKPHFDKGKAWSFTPVKRNIHFAEDGQLAWFDELLSTQMKLCRGSGVVRNVAGAWKIEHYVLSMTVPNEKTNELVDLKAALEDRYLMELTSGQIDTIALVK